MFAGANIALRSWISWWMLPLSLACGWAFSQVVSYVGCSRKDQAEPTGSPVLWAVLAAPAVCVFFGLAGDAILGGKFYGVLFAAAGCAFMAAAAELIVHHEELLIALTLLPGATGSLIFITRVPFALPTSVALALVGASLVATIAVALRHLPARWWLVPPLDRGNASMMARYFGLGIFSGLLVSIFIVLEPAQSGARGWPAAAAYPLVLSLGVMEWQLHTLRAGARNALVASHSLGDFARAARGKLAPRCPFLFCGTGCPDRFGTGPGVQPRRPDELGAPGGRHSPGDGVLPCSGRRRLRPYRCGAASVVARSCHIRGLGGRGEGHPAKLGPIQRAARVLRCRCCLAGRHGRRGRAGGRKPGLPWITAA